MPKPALEFFPVASVEWMAVSTGVWERVLVRDDDGVGLTRILRWDPGLDTSPLGPAVHDYFEEVLILSGSMRDLTSDMTFTAGEYACRPPGMVHGLWVSTEGCEMSRSDMGSRLSWQWVVEGRAECVSLPTGSRRRLQRSRVLRPRARTEGNLATSLAPQACTRAMRDLRKGGRLTRDAADRPLKGAGEELEGAASQAPAAC